MPVAVMELRLTIDLARGPASGFTATCTELGATATGPTRGKAFTACRELCRRKIAAAVPGHPVADRPHEPVILAGPREYTCIACEGTCMIDPGSGTSVAAARLAHVYSRSGHAPRWVNSLTGDPLDDETTP